MPLDQQSSLIPTKVTPTPITVRVTIYKLNVRSGPGTNFNRIGQVEQGDELKVIARNKKGDWVQIIFLQNDRGWVATKFTDLGNRVALLPIVPTSP